MKHGSVRFAPCQPDHFKDDLVDVRRVLPRSHSLNQQGREPPHGVDAIHAREASSELRPVGAAVPVRGAALDARLAQPADDHSDHHEEDRCGPRGDFNSARANVKPG